MILLFSESPGIPYRSAGIYRLATVLRRAGLEVEVVDFISKWDFPALLRYIDSVGEVDWYGFSARFHPPKVNIRSTNHMFRDDLLLNNPGDNSIFTYLPRDNEIALIQHLKSKNKKIVIGGPNSDVLKEFTTDLDIICTGYGDNAILAIHNHIVKGEPLIGQEYKGITLVDGDKDYPVTDLTNLETEYAYTDFVDNEESFPIEIGRGCMFHCAFCEFPHLGKKPGTYIRPKESIKQDILDRYHKYSAKRFIFLDDTFNDSIDKMRMIKEIREETKIDFQFWAYCRLDLLMAHPEQVDLIPQIGWKSMTFGIETFNRQSGRSVGKGSDPERLKSFLLTLRERFPDVKMQINLIFGLPHDTEESIRETVQWFIDNPHITNNVKMSPLKIGNAENRLFASKISLNPEKYGYTIIETAGILTNWKTENLTRSRVIELSQELQEKFNKLAKDLYPVTNSVVELRDHPVRFVYEGKVRNKLFYLVNNYIKNKIAHRQARLGN